MPLLSDRVPATLPEILRAAERGDWRLRAACLSAAGRAARAESLVQSIFRSVARLVPGVNRFIYAAGYRGRYVRGAVANGLVDRAWPVRVAAALALGECGSPTQIAALRRLLLAPFRAERIAAAAAIVSSGGTVQIAGSSLLAGAVSAPLFVGDTTRSIDVLTALAATHPEVLAGWRAIAGQEQPAGFDPPAWGSFLAGTPAPEASSGLQAEIDRYDEGETEYVLVKPFSPINRTKNIRLLHTFAALGEHLRISSNARVLDLGGGSAWASELLAKLGFVPITLDASSALLTVGRRRFAREGLTPRFVAADMTRLPIATGSMNAVMVLDALHHVPDVPAVFHEAFRVLEIGGAFLLAEPGEGHSETEKSRGEMLEYGVHEREIHVREVFEFARRAGFDDVRIVPNAVPNIAMTSAQLDAAMLSSADDWRALNGDEVTNVTANFMQAMFDHPVFVCRKGRRAADSLVPATLRAEIEPRLVRQGAVVTGSVTVRNTGDTLWLNGHEPGHVRLGIQLLDTKSGLLARDFSRTGFAADVAPGGVAEVTVSVILPDATASYVLKLDLVDEGVCWFEDVDSRPVYVSV